MVCAQSLCSEQVKFVCKREARWHVLDGTDRLVREASRNDGRFIDASSSVSSGECVRALLQLAVQDVVE